jgi:hypothetical protein
MLFSNYFIESLKGEIDDLEIELNYYHNNESISPNSKLKKVKKIISKIVNKKQVLETYFKYLIESNKIENGNTNQ